MTTAGARSSTSQALVTGASAGIGRAIVDTLVAGGALVLAGVLRQEDAAAWRPPTPRA